MIVFDRSLFSTAQTITLKLGELDITHSLDIIAPRDTLTGGDLVTVSGNQASRVFEIEKEPTVNIDGLIITGGNVAGSGGAIRNSGTLNLDSTIISGNNVISSISGMEGGDGGGIFNSGTLNLSNSTISSNTADNNTLPPIPLVPFLVGTSNDGGGGIYNTGNLTVSDTNIANNSVKGPGFGGGGIFNSGNATVNNSTISNNQTLRADYYKYVESSNGGGIHNEGAMTVNNSTISGNNASFGNIDVGGRGGGIFGSVTVNNSTISGNSADRFGGGIYSSGGSTVNNSTISGNSGSGIVNEGTSTVENSTISGNFTGIVNEGTSTINNSTISGNFTGIVNEGTSTINNSTISGNSSGGIVNKGTSTINNSTISGNSDGGIINSYTGTVTLLFSTVTQNLALNGGGVYQEDVPPTFPLNAVRGSFNVRNTIIAANLNSTNGVNPDVSGTFTSNGYNLIGDSTGSTGFDETIGDLVGTSDWVIDPRLACLDFNGGPTQTIALLPDSPAIGAADPIVLDSDPTTDQRGLPRRAADGSADIGAFQFS